MSKLNHEPNIMNIMEIVNWVNRYIYKYTKFSPLWWFSIHYSDSERFDCIIYAQLKPGWKISLLRTCAFFLYLHHFDFFGLDTGVTCINHGMYVPMDRLSFSQNEYWGLLLLFSFNYIWVFTCSLKYIYFIAYYYFLHYANMLSHPNYSVAILLYLFIYFWGLSVMLLIYWLEYRTWNEILCKG